MRDPKRIPRILGKLILVWEQYPDYRFGQMMINNGMMPDETTFWRIEDTVWEEHLDKILRGDFDNKDNDD